MVFSNGDLQRGVQEAVVVRVVQATAVAAITL
jgi:hypothetical protein